MDGSSPARPPVDDPSTGPEATFLSMVGEERDVYQLAELFDQPRHPPAHVLTFLVCPECAASGLRADTDRIRCEACGSSWRVSRGVIDLRPAELLDAEGSEWARLNRQFLNYHRSLTPHTLLCSAPIINYVSMRSGLRDARGLRVLDVGGGTGHTLCSFFRHPETLDYVLLDPNLRLLHDQFVRVYPELLDLPISHLLGVAEVLPFAEGTFDLVLSISAIDHYADYERFAAAAFRVLKPGGRILVSSHLDGAPPSRSSGHRIAKLFSLSFFEVVGRRLFFRKHRVGRDDHTHHFRSSTPIAECLEAAGFVLEEQEEFKGHFLVLARRPDREQRGNDPRRASGA